MAIGRIPHEMVSLSLQHALLEVLVDPVFAWTPIVLPLSLRSGEGSRTRRGPRLPAPSRRFELGGFDNLVGEDVRRTRPPRPNGMAYQAGSTAV